MPAETAGIFYLGIILQAKGKKFTNKKWGISKRRKKLQKEKTNSKKLFKIC